MGILSQGEPGGNEGPVVGVGVTRRERGAGGGRRQGGVERRGHGVDRLGARATTRTRGRCRGGTSREAIEGAGAHQQVSGGE
jgi:hypothetical protein